MTTEAERAVATLAAALLGERAPALLARRSGPSAEEGVRLCADLVAAPRAERLRALVSAMALDPPAMRARAEEAARDERPRLAQLVRALGAGGPHDARCSRLAVRVCRERISG